MQTLSIMLLLSLSLPPSLWFNLLEDGLYGQHGDVVGEDMLGAGRAGSMDEIT